jgi:integrase
MREIKPSKVASHSEQKYRVRLPRLLGGTSKYFTTEAEAERYASQMNKHAASFQGLFLKLPQDEQIGLMSLYHEYGSVDTLRKCASAGAEASTAVIKRVTLLQAIAECITFRKSQNAREYYVGQLERALTRFSDGVGIKYMNEVTAAVVSNWIAKQEHWSPKTRRNHITDVGTLCSFAVDKGYLAKNPCSKRGGVPRPMLDQKTPGILTPEEMELLLDRAAKIDPEMVPFIAVRAFSGIRHFELLRMDRNNVRVNHIRIDGPQTKTRERRLIEVDACLEAWLKFDGPFSPKNVQKRLFRIRHDKDEKTGEWIEMVKYPQNCLRHSFCSYHLVLYGAKDTAAKAGHSETMLYKNYRALVTKEDAEKWFALRPKSIPAAKPKPPVVNQDASKVAHKAAGTGEGKDGSPFANTEYSVSRADANPEADAHGAPEEVKGEVTPGPVEDLAVKQDCGGAGAGGEE